MSILHPSMFKGFYNHIKLGHENRLVRCSPHLPGFSRSNPHLTSLPHLSHLATSPLSPTSPTLLPDLSLPPFPPCHLTSLPHISHFATSPLSPTFPTLPPHLSPLPFPPCHLTSLPTFPTLPPHLSPHLSHLTTLPPFPTCLLTILPPFTLCHLATLPPFQLSQLTTLPPSQLVTLVLRDLTVAISITKNKISHSLSEAQPFPCDTNLRLRIPHTSNSPTPHIYSTQVSSLPSSNTRNTRANSSTR